MPCRTDVIEIKSTGLIMVLCWVSTSCCHCIFIIWGFGYVVVAVAFTCARDGGGLAAAAAAAVSAFICAIRVLVKLFCLMKFAVVQICWSS